MTLDVSIEHQLGDFALDVHFQVPAGLTVLFGESGAGKSSVVNAVAGLLRPDRGQIKLGERTLLDTSAGVNLPVRKRRIGYVFQDDRLFPHLSVRQNILYGRRFTHRDAPPADQQQIIAMLGIESLLDRRPAGLSGGEKQRVAIARALLCSPELILADEPLAALDEARKAEILPYFERLRDDLQIPVLYVSHSLSEVARLATTVVTLSCGRVTAVGPAAQVLSDPQLALGLREAGAMLTGKLVAHHADGLSELATAGGSLFVPRNAAPIGTRVRVRVEAQDVILSRARPTGLSAMNILCGTIRSITSRDGGDAIVVIGMGEGEGQDNLLARVTCRSVKALGLHVGDECHAIMKSVALAPGDIS
ncbi:molybdenum ABC transporter ATP-binding protein [uncultured Halopseudomonas sp.]|uniref:molybdenum ABC transporter ATP-binding protein n=1 Tax=uncultured Halopseudomonas sp. TaxID=2901193 RepID=UPI0030ECEB58|tara:strand:+ start:107433 stop:108521 length:1089 start_codon:yes stop_codon:yes gene_type:complete